jgi:hypothetical protein
MFTLPSGLLFGFICCFAHFDTAHTSNPTPVSVGVLFAIGIARATWDRRIAVYTLVLPVAKIINAHYFPTAPVAIVASAAESIRLIFVVLIVPNCHFDTAHISNPTPATIPA